MLGNLIKALAESNQYKKQQGMMSRSNGWEDSRAECLGGFYARLPRADWRRSLVIHTQRTAGWYRLIGLGGREGLYCDDGDLEKLQSGSREMSKTRQPCIAVAIAAIWRIGKNDEMYGTAEATECS